MMRTLYRWSAIPALATGLLLGACGDSNEPEGEGGHTPASAKLFIAGTNTELTPDIELVSGQTTRVEVRFYAEDGDLINIPAGHQTAINLAQGDFGTVTEVAGEPFQRDIAVEVDIGESTTVTIGYGHDAEADELTFGPFDITAVGGAPALFTLVFEPRVGAAAFACGTSYNNVGTTNSTITPTDWRMYLSNVRLLTASGSEVPLTLTAGPWQVDNVAMLDFEDATSGCQGTAETRTTVVGSAPSGIYSGVRFVLGLPFARNHADVTTAPAPLNLTGMFWSWNSGYIFNKVDFNSTGQPTGFFVHLGSTGCNGAGGTSVPTACTAENTPTITLTGFDPAVTPIVADLGALLAGSDVNTNSGGAPGCMSGATDAECGPIFSRLNLTWGGNPAGTQSFFKVDDN